MHTIAPRFSPLRSNPFLPRRWAFLALMAGLCAAPALAEDDDIEWSTYVEMEGQLFPSYLVATATWKPVAEDDADPSLIGDPYGSIGAYVSDLPENTRVKLVVKESKWFAASEQSGKTTDAGEYWIFPKVNWNYDALLRARQIEPVNVVMELFVAGKSVGTKSETLKVRSLNDCPLYIMPTDADGKPTTSEEDAETEGTDLSFMFAAYVNENHPWVDQITKEALEAEIVDSFTGYQSGDPEEVFKQVFAIWNVMQRRGMKYSDITTSSGESQLVFSQHVRLFDEAVTAKQANCVDGTVLFASILRKININPYLVLVPGHMYLAFDLDEEGEVTIGLETTMMGNTSLKKFEKKKLPAELVEENKNNASFEAFAAAVDAGSEALAESAEKFESEEPEHAQYQLISVAEARKMDILPLAWKKE
jgi:hypothetical protein